MIGLFLMLGFANVYAMRVNLSVALAVMVANHSVISDGKKVQESAEFSWSTTTQGFILSAFYYGYLLTHLPGGYLARKLGGATVIGVAVGATGALTLFTPLAARMHVGTLIALRVAMGLAEGSVFPAGHAVWSKWAPPLERSKLGTFNPSGAVAGIIISMFLSGYLADHYGWPCIFYVFGEFWFVDVTLLFWDFFFRQTVISTLDKTFLDRCLTTKNQKKQSDANNVLFFLSLGNYFHVDERFALHRIQLW